MAWYDGDSWLTYSFGPNLPAILVTLLLALSLPVLLHLLLYRQRLPAQLPTFLVIGPSGAGKTALVTHLETGSALPSRPSQQPLTVTATLPARTTQASAKYRSSADPTLAQRPRIRLIDTPGHPKLRSHATSFLHPAPATSKKKGATSLQTDAVIFVVDATTLNAGDPGLNDAAEFLHDILLSLQRRYERAKSSKSKEVSVLIAAAKDDLFTAVPAALARKTLAKEIGRVREARAWGLLGVEVDEQPEEAGLAGYTGVDDEQGEGFEFDTMREYGIHVEILGGNVREGESGVERWWGWIGGCL